MHAEIVAIGTELTTGAKLDTNSQWLSLQLAAIGLPVKYHVTVADDRAANVDVMRLACERSDVVLISGGLGPTLDDLTREVLAEMVGQPLVLHEPSLEIIKTMFARRNRVMPERNTIQAKFPKGSEVIPNPRGTAPGIYMEIPRVGRPPCRVAAMPGVPSEMKPMFIESVLPRLIELGAGRVIRHARVNCFGLGESAFEELLGDITARGRDPEVGITVHEATITLRIVAEGDCPETCDAKIAVTRSAIHERLGLYVFGEEDDELPDAVMALLRSRNETVALVEAATGGLLANWMLDIPGAERTVKGALVLPTIESVQAALGLTLDASRPRGEIAAQVSERSRTVFGAGYSLCVSATRPQDAADPDSAPVALIALSGPAGTRTVEINLLGDPAIQRSRAAKTALDLLRQVLLG